LISSLSESNINLKVNKFFIITHLFITTDVDPPDLHVARAPAKVIALNAEALFMDMYNKYYPSLKTRLHCEDADDIAQETFKKLWIKRNDLHLVVHPEQYVFTIARNIFLDGKNHLTKNKKMQKHISLTERDHNNITEEEIIYRDTKRICDLWLQRLPVRMRRTYSLKKQGYRIREIALHLDIKEQTIKNSLQKAEKKMEGLVEELGLN
jgi:RNA polymerase sigma factor (sigma-70 family)